MERRRILVVDDSELVTAMASAWLDKEGYEVSVAGSAAEADRIIFSEARPHLVILDVMLPVMDGDRKAKQLKSREETRALPILLLSSKPEEELKRLVREAGCDGYVRKPFTRDILATAVRRHLP